MESGLCLANYAVIAVFFAAMIGVGLWSQRRARDAAAYFGKDKSASWWLSGISFYMNSFSAHGAFAMTTPGDTSMATKADIEKMVGGGSARVDR